MEDDHDIDDVEEDEEMKEDEDDDDEEEDETEKPPSAKPKGRRKPRSVLTGRGVTLGMLLDDGVMEPGEKCLSIDYLVLLFYNLSTSVLIRFTTTTTTTTTIIIIVIIINY